MPHRARNSNTSPNPNPSLNVAASRPSPRPSPQARRELIVRGPRAAVQEALQDLWLRCGVRIELPRTAAATREPAPRVKLPAVFIQAARAAPAAVAAATVAAQVCADTAARAATAAAALPASKGLGSGAAARTEASGRRTIGKTSQARRKVASGQSRGGGHRVAWSAAEDRALRLGINKHGSSSWVRILEEGGDVWHAKHRDAQPRGSSLRDRARTLGLL